MTGFFQRMALSAVKPGGSIQPILSPLFSPSSLTSGPVSIETEERFTVSVPTQIAPRTKPWPSLDAPGAHALQAPEPSPKQERPTEVTESPLPTSAASAPGLKEKAEPLSFLRVAEKRDDQSAEEPVKPRRETTAVQPSVENQAIEAPRQSAALVKSATPTFVRLFTPLLPVPDETKAPIIVPRLPANRGDQSQEGALKLRSETIVRTQPKQKVEHSSKETESSAIAASEDVRQPDASTPAPTFASDRNERMSSPTRPVTRTEPDEIQIHIGRIEVVAVLPAPVAPAASKPKRGAPALDEYLRRSNRTSL
jgi:hypothetical protein